MDTSKSLNLPYMHAAQALKHITYNEALEILDAVVNMSVIEIASTPPQSLPNQGVRYLVSGSPSPQGAWSGKANAVAIYGGETWNFIAPNTGWICWVETHKKIVIYSDGVWSDLKTGSASAVEKLGINAQADDTNRLSINAASSLFNHDGKGHQLKINKSNSSETASVLYQTAFTGHAECGLTQENGFQIKLSEDGQNWKTGASFDSATGQLTTPGFQSGEITVPHQSAIDIPTSKVGGIIAIMVNDPNYPQVTHSGLFAFDIGSSPYLISLASGPSFNVSMNTVLTGTTGSNGSSTLGVTAGRLQIECQFGSARSYHYAFLC